MRRASIAGAALAVGLSNAGCEDLVLGEKSTTGDTTTTSGTMTTSAGGDGGGTTSTTSTGGSTTSGGGGEGGAGGATTGGGGDTSSSTGGGPECSTGDHRCVGTTGRELQSCDGNGNWDPQTTLCDHYCLGDECGVPPSCTASPKCGSNESCCAANVVPEATSFNRGNNSANPAKVHEFVMDNYEVTVGRFRQFVMAYSSSMPSVGDGKNPNNAGDAGWDASWAIPSNQTDLKAGLKSCSASVEPSHWTDTPMGKEELPMTCVTWALAQAFCIYDGGRLPTEAEWEMAAMGAGTEYRYYPWSSPPGSTTIDSTYAVFQSAPPATQMLAVGAKAPGKGKFGHFDLAGNAWELVEDSETQSWQMPCNDCAVLTNAAKRYRGGAVNSSLGQLTTTFRSAGFSLPIAMASNVVGFRCVHSI